MRVVSSVENLNWRPKQKLDVAHVDHGWATEKIFHFRDGKNAISGYILEEFGWKIQRKLGQIGQNTQKLVKVGHFFEISLKLVKLVKVGDPGALH